MYLLINSALKFLASVVDESYSLEDSMQAHEINDAKIDPKHDISHSHTIQFWVDHNKIRTPDSLTIQ